MTSPFEKTTYILSISSGFKPDATYQEGAAAMGKFHIRTTSTGVKFDLKADNGETIAKSEVYASQDACIQGIASVRKNAPAAAVENQTETGYKKQKHPKFEVYTDKSGQYRFRLKASNGRIIAASDGYQTLSGCLNGVVSDKKNALGAALSYET